MLRSITVILRTKGVQEKHAHPAHPPRVSTVCTLLYGSVNRVGVRPPSAPLPMSWLLSSV